MESSRFTLRTCRSRGRSVNCGWGVGSAQSKRGAYRTVSQDRTVCNRKPEPPMIMRLSKSTSSFASPPLHQHGTHCLQCVDHGMVFAFGICAYSCLKIVSVVELSLHSGLLLDVTSGNACASLPEIPAYSGNRFTEAAMLAA